MENESEYILGTAEMNIGGVPLKMEMSLPAKPVKLKKMLPVFQKMSDTFVNIGITAAENKGRKISCRAGCGACCRQAVPISETEVYRIAELVENLPEPRKTKVKKKFDKAFEHFTKVGWFKKMDEFISQNKENNDEDVGKKLSEIVLEYFYEKIPCPFLENESCSIHPDRPIACREYLVDSPAENCSNPTLKTVNMVSQPIEVSKVLRQISRANVSFDSPVLIPLVSALEIAGKHRDESSKKPGNEWMNDFFEILAVRKSGS
jgi:Fe-S-cluster containining protein